MKDFQNEIEMIEIASDELREWDSATMVAFPKLNIQNEMDLSETLESIRNGGYVSTKSLADLFQYIADMLER